MTNSNIKIYPQGWIYEFLNIQKDGLTGHIENALEPYVSFFWNKYDKDILDKTDPLWKWVYFEQTAYYLDGAITLANLLNEQELYKKTSKIIYDVINNADNDGYLGPLFLKEPAMCNRWPFVVFARACLALYNNNHDINIIKALEKHYLNNKVIYSHGRNVVNIETMLLVYEITKNKMLLDLAIKTYDLYQEDENKDPSYCSNYTLAKQLLDNNKPIEHGVTYNEIAKLGAILYIYTKDKKYLYPSINAYKKICKYHLLPDGLHSSNEYLNGKRHFQTHETCNVSDFTWSLLYLLKATKNAKYGDLIENCIYNAGIGSVLEDFKAFQYFSGINQIILEKHSNHNFYRKGSDWMCYKPGHETQCCAGNVNRFFPNFVANMYLSDKNNLYAIFYGSSKIELNIKNNLLKCKQISNYPFDDYINFSFSSQESFDFNFYLRIPSWAKKYKVFYNEKELNIKKYKGFVKIKCNSKANIKLYLPSKIQVEDYNNTGIIVKKGPILYALGMKGNRKKMPYSNYPMYEITPNKDFNYGIDIKKANPQLKIINKIGNPFDLNSVYYAIEITAYKINNFDIIRKNKIFTTNNAFNKPKFVMHGKFSFTPYIKKYELKDVKEKRILLYPYGACKLRLGILPKVVKIEDVT